MQLLLSAGELLLLSATPSMAVSVVQRCMQQTQSQHWG
jgi:hypothetical protein